MSTNTRISVRWPRFAKCPPAPPLAAFLAALIAMLLPGSPALAQKDMHNLPCVRCGQTIPFGTAHRCSVGDDCSAAAAFAKSRIASGAPSPFTAGEIDRIMRQPGGCEYILSIARGLGYKSEGDLRREAEQRRRDQERKAAEARADAERRARDAQMKADEQKSDEERRKREAEREARKRSRDLQADADQREWEKRRRDQELEDTRRRAEEEADQHNWLGRFSTLFDDEPETRPQHGVRGRGPGGDAGLGVSPAPPRGAWEPEDDGPAWPAAGGDDGSEPPLPRVPSRLRPRPVDPYAPTGRPAPAAEPRRRPTLDDPDGGLGRRPAFGTPADTPTPPPPPRTPTPLDRALGEGKGGSAGTEPAGPGKSVGSPLDRLMGPDGQLGEAFGGASQPRPAAPSRGPGTALDGLIGPGSEPGRLAGIQPRPDEGAPASRALDSLPAGSDPGAGRALDDVASRPAPSAGSALDALTAPDRVDVKRADDQIVQSAYDKAQRRARLRYMAVDALTDPDKLTMTPRDMPEIIVRDVAESLVYFFWGPTTTDRMVNEAEDAIVKEWANELLPEELAKPSPR